MAEEMCSLVNSAERTGISENVEVDRISGLPDELLTQILSFLSTKEAVQTCVLSKTWKDTWASMRVLDFNINDFLTDDFDVNCTKEAVQTCVLSTSVARFLRFVNGVLDNRGPTNLDTVRYTHDVDSRCVQQTSLAWLDCVAALMPRLINIDICSAMMVDLPDAVFCCASLEYLKLLQHPGGELNIAPPSVHLPSLKVLKLRGVLLQDDFMQKLLAGCPSLQKLKITSCYLHLSSISSDVLKEVILIDCHIFKRLEISCPGLVSLSMEFMFERIGRGIALKNMKSVENVSLGLYVWGWNVGHADGLPVLNLSGLSNATNLHIFVTCPKLKEQLEKDIANCNNIFNNLMKLEIGGWNMIRDFHLVACLLRHCPNLKELNLSPSYSNARRRNAQREPRQALLRDAWPQNEYLETVIIHEWDMPNVSQELIKTLGTLYKKIGNVSIK